MAWVGGDVDGVDVDRFDRDRDPPLSGAIVGAKVGSVLRADLVGEFVVVVGVDAGGAPHLEEAVGICQVQQQQAALRALSEVSGFTPSRVERQFELSPS